MTERNIAKIFTVSLMVIMLIGGSAITLSHKHSQTHPYTDSQMAGSATLLSIYSK